LATDHFLNAHVKCCVVYLYSYSFSQYSQLNRNVYIIVIVVVIVVTWHLFIYLLIYYGTDMRIEKNRT